MEETNNNETEMPLFTKVYCYDKNGYYLGIGQGDKSPEDDTYLIPAYSTIKVPPEVQDGYIAKFDEVEDEWDIVEKPKPPVAPTPKKSEIESLQEEVANLKLYIASIMEDSTKDNNTTKEALSEVNELADPS